MKNLILSVLMIASFSSNGQVSKPLYTGEIPNYIPGPNNQTEAVTGGILRISNVTEPRFTFYPSKAMTAVNMPLVIIFPGGGYRILAASHEGSDVAKKLNEIGIHAMVVHYRLPDSTRQVDMKFAPLQDAQQAIRVARQQAANWNVDVNKIGVMGFSAGGHLAASAANFEPSIEPIEKFGITTTAEPGLAFNFGSSWANFAADQPLVPTTTFMPFEIAKSTTDSLTSRRVTSNTTSAPRISINSLLESSAACKLVC